MKFTIFFLFAGLSFGAIWSVKKKPPPAPTALDEYIRASESRSTTGRAARTAGSTWLNDSTMSDLASDLKASHVDDVVTITVSEQASAVSTGATKTSRVSSANNTITNLGGPTAGSPLANLVTLANDTELNGAGSTSRTTALTTSLTARVTHVLPNGFLVVEGAKNIQINSDWQTITVRGVVRPADLAPDNSVVSSRLGQLEVKLDGKGVINDAIRRPAFLYRLLLGLLPF